MPAIPSAMLFAARALPDLAAESGPSSGRHPITIITHEDPIGRGPTNYIIQADLSNPQDSWREQLWTHQLTEDTFEVSCLPFFTYGICYRDVVTIDSNHLVTAVVRKSGHRTLRAALVREHANRDQFTNSYTAKPSTWACPTSGFRGPTLPWT